MVLASSGTPQRARRFAHVLVATGALALALAGCSGDSTPTPPLADPTAEATPLADYDTTDVTLVRGEFCEMVAEAAVAAALGDESAESASDDSWQPGARLPGSKDISNEFGCSWSNGSATARAWVFAPPTASGQAADFAEETVGRKCQELTAAAELGRPSVAQECADLTGIYGLVGDAWLGCEIGGTKTDAARVGEWCVAVLDAMRTA